MPFIFTYYSSSFSNKEIYSSTKRYAWTDEPQLCLAIIRYLEKSPKRPMYLVKLINRNNEALLDISTDANHIIEYLTLN